jgi:hypothetical protein
MAKKIFKLARLALPATSLAIRDLPNTFEGFKFENKVLDNHEIGGKQQIILHTSL